MYIMKKKMATRKHKIVISTSRRNMHICVPINYRMTYPLKNFNFILIIIVH